MKPLLGVMLIFPISLIGIVRPPILYSPLEINPQKKIDSTDKNGTVKQKKIPTSWGGSELTQEDKLFGGNKIVTYNLRGGAWILHDKIKLSARTIEVIGEDALSGFLKGGVKIEDMENKAVLYSGKGVYDKIKETVVLDERPLIIFRGKNKEKTKVTAPYIKRYLGESKIVLENGVILENTEYTIYAESAVMMEKEDRINMDNFPYIFGKNKFMTGEKLFYDSEKKDIILENSAIIIQTSMEKKRKKIKDKNQKIDEGKIENSDAKSDEVKSAEKEEADVKMKITTIFSGDKIINHSGNESARYVGIFGNAKMKRPDTEFQAVYIKAFGKNNEKVEARNNVSMLDIENNMRLSGNLLEYDKPTEYTHITEDAKIEFLNEKSGEVNSTLTSVEIERFADKKELVARGDVTIVTEDSIAKGEFATYFEGEEKIYLEGNPTLNRGGKIVKCGKIIIYPNLNKVFLSEGVNVEPAKENKNEFSP